MSVQNTMKQEEKSSIHLYFIYLFVIITITLIILRILLYFFEISEWIQDTKDIDFNILIEGMNNAPHLEIRISHDLSDLFYFSLGV